MQKMRIRQHEFWRHDKHSGRFAALFLQEQPIETIALRDVFFFFVADVIRIHCNLRLHAPFRSAAILLRELLVKTIQKEVIA